MDHAIYTAMGAASQTLNQQRHGPPGRETNGGHPPVIWPMPLRPVFARS